ncbi:hypothetical protein [Thalassococcus lentus]|uniref:APCDD1 domain-containing protein n=1 Tax=Thalassococcus lentus TaxID=1210524 RepID=A0ABT4XTA0_9RHOB|nr:hypothetical protein [Thalassococcus lentus]MDA7425142.1 hypothetical protein [Thalassococcus lentus]
MTSKAMMLSAAIVAAQFGSPVVAQSTNEAGLDGQFASIACEVRPQPNQDGTMGEWWLTRDITIADDRIDAVFTTYAGPGCGFALQELHFGGGIEIVGPSDVIDGAVEADLTIDDYVRIKPLVEDFAAFLNSAPDGACLSAEWTVGQERDILQDGCLVLGVQPNTPTVEYEILATRGDMIFFGARPTDGTFIVSPDKRPAALLVGAARK